MSRRRSRLLVVTAAAAAVITAALVAAVMTMSSGSSARGVSKLAMGDRESSAQRRFGNGNEKVGYDEWRGATRAYPASGVAVAWRENARKTFERIAAQTGRDAPDPSNFGVWQPYGPQKFAEEPGVLAFGGAAEKEASRTPALVISPNCSASNCRVWAGTSGGGIWRTDNALDPEPDWKFLSTPFEQQTTGTMTLQGSNPNILYVGTGEPNRCGSGCQAGVGIWRSPDGGDTWNKLPSACVSNVMYTCATPGQDAFLSRGISQIVIDPTNPNHLIVGSAKALRGLSATVGNGGQFTAGEPGANAWGLWESMNGGATFEEVWNGNGSFRGVIDVGLDPTDPGTVYASAFQQGIWRRSPSLDGAGDKFSFRQVFATEHGNTDTGRTQFDLTTKSIPDPVTGVPVLRVRMYVTDGSIGAPNPPAAFWRTDNSRQPAGSLLGSQAGGQTAPAGNGNPFGVYYPGWQKLTSSSLSSPYYATNNFCTGQCWYDQDVHTPAGRPDEVYVLGSYLYGELPCYTTGVGCGSGVSNGRGVLYSTTAGDPLPSALNRTFTDMTMDRQNVPANHCALFFSLCGDPVDPFYISHHAIHPDQHEIVVNPNRPTQFFEASDGGVVRTSGKFGNMSEACGLRGLSGAGLTTCQRLLSRVPSLLGTINKDLSQTLQFINLGFNPQNPCHIIAGTQDNSTWHTPNCDSDTWPKTIYGDGGWSGFDSKNPAWMFNEFVLGYTDSNFKGGDPEKWVIASGSMIAPNGNPKERVAFYWPLRSDPNPPLFNGSQTHPIFSGMQHIWRTWAFGAGRPVNAVPQDTTPDVATYEAECPEFTTFGGDPNCGDYQPLGGPLGSPAGDLTGPNYGGTSRGAGSVASLARSKADQQTMWATTSGGRVFMTLNANDPTPNNVVFYRLDNMPGASASPTRYPASIYPDASNPNRAYVAYSGYNAATPSTPGHLFRVDVTRTGGIPTNATWTNLNVEAGTSQYPTPQGGGDLPVNDVIVDDPSQAGGGVGTLYAATDFGVLKGTPTGASTYSWTKSPGINGLEVTHLVPIRGNRDACTSLCAHGIYAVTHSQGIWVMSLP